MSEAQDKKLREIAEKFRRDMQKLGLGVSIKVGDGPYVRISDAPDESGSPGSSVAQEKT